MPTSVNGRAAGDVEKIHQKHHELQTFIESTRDEFVQPGSSTHGMLSAVRRSNSLVDRWGNTLNAADDSRFLATTTDLVNQRARNGAAAFDLAAYTRQLADVLANSTAEPSGAPAQLTIESLGRLVMSFSARAVTADFMVGPMEIDKKPVERRRAVRQTIGQESAPDAVDGLNNNFEADQALLIQQVYDTLTAQQEGEDDEQPEPVLLYEFILNPCSFSETVENLFFVSFLVRDGKVVFGYDENNLPVISLKQTAASTQSRDQPSQPPRKVQLVMDFTFAQWKQLCDVFDDIVEPIIAHRYNSDSSAMRDANGDTSDSERG